jgi:dTDP-4-dehydrorhamnose 3,5-epimerase-like enzyme
MEAPALIRGGIHVDDRGETGFVNDFTFAGVKRFYTIRNHARGTVRAWHGHRREGKYFHVTKGAMLICAVAIDDWERPSLDLPVVRHVLSEKQPALLWVPPGHANGLMALDEDARLLVFSTATLAESLADDVRFPARHWDPWSVEER